jgi:Family of unknown function (DUF6641)
VVAMVAIHQMEVTTMSKVLSKLTLVEVQARGHRDPVVQRREKLVDRLEEQKRLISDPHFMRVERKRRNGQLQEVTKQIRPWWVTKGDGSVVLSVKAGGGALELAPGKYGVAAPDVTTLPDTIDTIVTAVNAGELDVALSAAARSARIPGKPAKSAKPAARAGAH